MRALPTFPDEWQQTLNWQPSASQTAAFQQLYEQILEGNRQFNLTRITEPLEFWEKHLWDSLRGVQPFLASSGFRIIDIGTGAGFPGLPIAIIQPGWSVALLDSTRKKIQFINTVIDTLGLTNATTLVERVEHLGHQRDHRESYNLALIRAVAAAPVCAEYTLPLLKPGGTAILYRGQWSAAETSELEPIISHLGGAIEAIDSFKTPVSQSDRTCIYLKKVAPTPPGFPRAIGIPAQQPLA
jgi:16S rRNA (guanine527-N7)-methyltransferase